VALALHRAGQERGLPPPERFARWATDVGRQLLVADQPPLVLGGIELARELRLRPLHEELAALATDQTRSGELRSAALEACVANDAQLARPLLAQVLGDAGEAMPLRQKAAGALANLSGPEARDVLIGQLRISSDRLAVEIAAALALRREGGDALLNEVAAGRASPRLLQERMVSERLHQAGVPDVDARLAKLTENLPPADERIARLIAQRREAFSRDQPNVALGRQVFQKTCAACHRVAGEGAKIGPDLDGVGLRGLDRLLEDVLDPSRNIDQAFRATVINTSDGRTLSGLVLREEGAVLVLADAQGKELRLPTADIEERAIARLSPMPANVADLVPEADFLNLMAFLLSQKSRGQDSRVGGRGRRVGRGRDEG
jgi:putative heme-binding domain-containing protein